MADSAKKAAHAAKEAKDAAKDAKKAAKAPPGPTSKSWWRRFWDFLLEEWLGELVTGGVAGIGGTVLSKLWGRLEKELFGESKDDEFMKYGIGPLTAEDRVLFMNFFDQLSQRNRNHFKERAVETCFTHKGDKQELDPDGIAIVKKVLEEIIAANGDLEKQMKLCGTYCKREDEFVTNIALRAALGTKNIVLAKAAEVDAAMQSPADEFNRRAQDRLTRSKRRLGLS